MAEKTPAEKLRLKPGMTAAILHVPDGMRELLGVPDGVTPTTSADGADFILDFASTQTEAEERVTAFQPYVTDKTVTWLAYPKGSKAAGLDLNRDTIAEFVRTVGLVVNSIAAIDENWSAVRMRPLKPGE